MIDMRRKIKWTIRIIIVLIIGIILINKAITNSRFKANFDTPKNRYEAWEQDLTFFKDNYFKVCKSFPKDSVDKALILIDSIKNNINGLSDNKIQLLLSKCVSMANDAHTSVHFGKYNRIPLRFYLFDDGLFVIKVKRGFEEYLGYKVNRISDKTISELISIADSYMSGNDSWNRYKSSYFLASPDFYEGIGLTQQSDSIKIEFVSNKDTIVNYLKSDKRTDYSDEYDSWRDLAITNTLIFDTTNWVHLKKDNSLLYLSKPNEPAFFTRIDSIKALYVSVNTSTKISGFVKEIEQEIGKNNYQNLIIDFRLNGGGNYLQQAAFSKIIPKSFEGNIFIITGNGTFSAGICTVARLKYYSGEKAVVIGQVVGDRLKFWAEGKQFRLPNSRIRIRAATGYHDWQNNNYIPFKSFWINIFFGVPAKDLSLDYKVKNTFADYKNGIDKVLSKITTLHNTQYSQ